MQSDQRVSDAAQVIAVLEGLGRHTDRLIDLEPAIRCTLQSAARDRRRALRACNFLEAEDWRRAMVRAGALLQATEDRA